MWWLLAREVLRLRGVLARNTEWDVMIDMFIYRDPEEQEKEEAVDNFSSFGNEAAAGEEAWADVKENADWAAAEGKPADWGEGAAESWAEETPTAGW